MNRLLRIPEVAARLGVSRASTYRLIQDGEIPAVTVRTVKRVPEAAVDDYIARKVAEASAVPQGA